MPIEIETSEGLLVVSDQEIRAVARHAEYKAHLTAAVLDATGLFPERPICLPAGYLLELAAVLELGMWERQGLRPFLNCDLPTFREAADALLARANRGPAAFDSPDDSSSLSSRLLRVWMKSFAWDSHEFFATNIVLGEVDEDQFVELMTQFVWKNRRELSRMLAEPREPNQN
jgi:hypothetical protein